MSKGEEAHTWQLEIEHLTHPRPLHARDLLLLPTPYCRHKLHRFLIAAAAVGTLYKRTAVQYVLSGGGGTAVLPYKKRNDTGLDLTERMVSYNQPTRAWLLSNKRQQLFARHRIPAPPARSTSTAGFWRTPGMVRNVQFSCRSDPYFTVRVQDNGRRYTKERASYRPTDHTHSRHALPAA